MESNNNNRKLFLVILSIATLIITIAGGTFAYFSAQTNSEANAVGAGGAEAPELSIKDNMFLGTDMIPATENVATYAAFVVVNEGKTNCLDDNENRVCGIYDFQINNNSDIAQTVNITLTTTYINKFTNLSYKVFEGDFLELTSNYTTSTSIINAPNLLFTHTGGGKKVPALNGTDTIQSNVIIPAGEYAHYVMVIWLNETNTNQNAEAGGSWSGTINATTGTGTGITGVIDFNRPAPTSSSSGNTR